MVLPINTSSALQLNATNFIGETSAQNISNIEYNESIFGRTSAISLSDGKVSSLWDKVTGIQIPAYGSSGKLSSVYGKDQIYFLLTHDLDIDWIALQWDQDFTGDPLIQDNDAIPMDANDDMWVLGLPPITALYGDSYSAGQGETPYIYHDEQGDLEWEKIETLDTTIWEIKRDLVTNDSEGRDVQFEINGFYTVFAASNEFHGIESAITEFRFKLSPEFIGAKKQETVLVRTTVAVNIFFIKYFNFVLVFGIGMSVIVIIYQIRRR